MRKYKIFGLIVFFALNVITYSAKFVDTVNAQRFKGMTNGGLGGSYENLGKDIIEAKIKDKLDNSLTDTTMSMGNTRVVNAFNAVDWAIIGRRPFNQSRDMNEMEVKSEIRVKFPDTMATEATQLAILDKKIETLEYAMKSLQLQTAEWKNSLSQISSNDGGFYKDYMSDLKKKKDELKKIMDETDNSLASFTDIEKAIKDRFGSNNPNLAPAELMKDQLLENKQVLTRMLKQFRQIELDIQADSANYEAVVFSERVANANNHIKALQLLAETMGGVHRALNSLTSVFIEMNVREQVQKMYALELERQKALTHQLQVAELDYHLKTTRQKTFDYVDTILPLDQKFEAQQQAIEMIAHSKAVALYATEKLNTEGFYDNVSKDIIGRKLIDAYGLSALQKDLFKGIDPNLAQARLKEYAEQRMERIKQMTKSVLEQRIGEAIAKNQFLKDAIAIQKTAKSLINNPAGFAEGYLNQWENNLKSEVNNQVVRVTNKVNEEINQAYNKTYGKEINQANEKIRAKVDEINRKLAENGATTRINANDLLIQNANVSVNVNEIRNKYFSGY